MATSCTDLSRELSGNPTTPSFSSSFVELTPSPSSVSALSPSVARDSLISRITPPDERVFLPMKSREDDLRAVREETDRIYVDFRKRSVELQKRLDGGDLPTLKELKELEKIQEDLESVYDQIKKNRTFEALDLDDFSSDGRRSANSYESDGRRSVCSTEPSQRMLEVLDLAGSETPRIHEQLSEASAYMSKIELRNWAKITATF